MMGRMKVGKILPHWRSLVTLCITMTIDDILRRAGFLRSGDSTSGINSGHRGKRIK